MVNSVLSPSAAALDPFVRVTLALKQVCTFALSATILPTVLARSYVALLPTIRRRLPARAPLRRIPLLRLSIRAQKSGLPHLFRPVTVVQVVASLRPAIFRARFLRETLRPPLALASAENLKPLVHLHFRLILTLRSAPIAITPTDPATVPWTSANFLNPRAQPPHAPPLIASGVLLRMDVSAPFLVLSVGVQYVTTPKADFGRW